MFRITDVKVSALSTPFHGDWRSALGVAAKRDIVLVQVLTDEKIVGVGEAHHASSPLSVASLVSNSLKPVLLGEDPLLIEFLLEKMFHAVPYAGSLANIGISGVDLALWDIVGKKSGLPVYRILGGHKRKIRAYAGELALGWKEPAKLAEEATKYVSEGFTAVKLRVGQGTEKDEASVKAVREAVGSSVDIMVDANTSYSYNIAVRAVRKFEKYDVLWVEEPIAPDDLEGMTNLSKTTDLLIAAGENIYSKYGYRDFLARGALRVANADCTKVGGISEAKKIASMADAWHAFFAPHILGSAIDLAANLSVMAAASNSLLAEYDPEEYSPFRDDLTMEPLKAVHGYIELPDRPGLGVELNETALSKYRYIPGITYV